MIKNYFYRSILFLFSILFIFSCSKQGQLDEFTPLIPITFISGLPQADLKVDVYYEGELAYKGFSGMQTILVKSGKKGNFTFKDGDADTVLVADEIDVRNQRDTVYLFRTTPEEKVSLIKYAKGSEPAPRPGYIKLRIANAARLSAGEKIDIIFKQMDPLTFESNPIDSIAGITKDFPDSYVEIKQGQDQGYPILDYEIEFKNSNTGEKIKSKSGLPFANLWGAYTDTGLPGKIFTLFVSEEKQSRCLNGFVEVNGTCYIIGLNNLFSE